MDPLKRYWIVLDRLLAVVAAALGVVSIVLNDADKAPLYFLLAYLFLRAAARE